jgi:hypothetical protein
MEAESELVIAIERISGVVFLGRGVDASPTRLPPTPYQVEAARHG